MTDFAKSLGRQPAYTVDHELDAMHKELSFYNNQEHKEEIQKILIEKRAKFNGKLDVEKQEKADRLKTAAESAGFVIDGTRNKE